MTPRRGPWMATSLAVAGSRFGGTPGFSRVRSGEIVSHEFPPSVERNICWWLMYSLRGSFVENTMGSVHVLRHGPLRVSVGATFRFCPVVQSYLVAVSPKSVPGCSGSAAISPDSPPTATGRQSWSLMVGEFERLGTA